MDSSLPFTSLWRLTSAMVLRAGKIHMLFLNSPFPNLTLSLHRVYTLYAARSYTTKV